MLQLCSKFIISSLGVLLMKPCRAVTVLVHPKSGSYYMCSVWLHP